jgi:phage-related protein
MIESVTILNRNFYDLESKVVDQDVYLADYGVYLGQQSGNLWKDILVPANRHESEQIPGMEGLMDYDCTTYAERKLTLPFYVDSTDENTLRKIQQIFSLQSIYKIVLDEHPYRYLEVKTDGQIDFECVRANGYTGLFVVNFIAFSPMWKSYYTSLDVYDYYEYRSIYDNLGILPIDVGDCAFTNVSLSEPQPPYYLLNHGSADAELIVWMNGTGTDIVLTNVTADETFTISTITDEDILIDGIRGIVSDANLTSGIVAGETELKTSLFSGVFLKLKPGLNTITITGTTLDLMNLSFLYRHTYL